MADAGDYFCQADNKYASNITSSVCKMQIRRKLIYCVILKCYIRKLILTFVVETSYKEPAGLSRRYSRLMYVCLSILSVL